MSGNAYHQYDDEKQIIDDLRAGGDPAHRACAALYRRYARELVRRLGRIDRSVGIEDREDAVQAVFEQLYEGREFYRTEGSLLACLTSCARHRLADLLRQR